MATTVIGTCRQCCPPTNAGCSSSTDQCSDGGSSYTVPATLTWTITKVHDVLGTNIFVPAIGVPVTLTFGSSPWPLILDCGNFAYYGTFTAGTDSFGSSTFYLCVSCIFAGGEKDWGVSIVDEFSNTMTAGQTCLNWTCHPFIIPFTCLIGTPPYGFPCNAELGNVYGIVGPEYACDWFTATAL